jgi:hypothetical protein
VLSSRGTTAAARASALVVGAVCSGSGVVSSEGVSVTSASARSSRVLVVSPGLLWRCGRRSGNRLWACDLNMLEHFLVRFQLRDSPANSYKPNMLLTLQMRHLSPLCVRRALHGAADLAHCLLRLLTVLLQSLDLLHQRLAFIYMPRLRKLLHFLQFSVNLRVDRVHLVLVLLSAFKILNRFLNSRQNATNPSIHRGNEVLEHT